MDRDILKKRSDLMISFIRKFKEEHPSFNVDLLMVQQARPVRRNSFHYTLEEFPKLIVIDSLEALVNHV